MPLHPRHSEARAVAVVVIVVLSAAAASGCLGIERTEWAYKVTQIAAVQKGSGLDGTGVIVGIVDSGIDPDHPSLDHIRIRAWRDYVNGREQPYDDYGHGTHVAGIVASKGGAGDFLSGANVKGVAPEVDLIVVKACGTETCESEAVERGIDFATSNGADIIVLSLGGQQGLLPLGDRPIEAVNRATRAGVYVVAAAGNAGTEPGDVASPSSATYAIAVGAVDRNRNVPDFSQRGDAQDNHGTCIGGQCVGGRNDPHKKPELVAPGVDILSTWKDGTYARATGTSQAAPFVGGAIALMLEEHPQWKRTGSKGGSQGAVVTMKTVLTETAQPVPGQQTPHDRAAGYGLLQVDDAMKRLGAQ